MNKAKMILCAGLVTAGTLFCMERKNGFFHHDKGLYYQNAFYSVRSEKPKGWTSIKVKGKEFLKTGKDFGGICFKNKERFYTRFTGYNNSAHNNMNGRYGSVADGVFLLKITPFNDRAGFELYAGFNKKEDHDLVLLLSSDVELIRFGRLKKNKSGAGKIFKKGGKAAKGREALLAHKSGVSLLVKSVLSPGKNKRGKPLPPPAFKADSIMGPDGQKHAVLIFPCKGFAMNAFHFYVDPAPDYENFIVKANFDVKSSRDNEVRQNTYIKGLKNVVYDKNTKLDFAMKFKWLKKAPFQGYGELKVVHALGKTHFYEKVKIAGKKGRKQLRVQFHPEFHMPGVSEVWCRLYDKNMSMLWCGRYRMAYELENFEPNIYVQPDFRAFWDDTLAKLEKIPLKVSIKRHPKYKDYPDFKVYEVRFNTWNNKRIWAALWVPREGEGPFPAIVTAHPGAKGYRMKKNRKGLYGSRIRQKKGFVTISPFVRGYDPNKPKEVPFNKPWWGPLKDRDSYVARSWYCSLVRAIDALATRPQWADLDRLVALGGSQGGAFALVTAALDKRVDYCFADCPSNAQLHEVIDGKYGTFGLTAGQAPPGEAERVKKLLSYYNPANFCPYIRCPTYVGSNIGDVTVHSIGPLACYRNLTKLPKSEKAFFPGQNHFHGSGWGLIIKRKEILAKLRKKK